MRHLLAAAFVSAAVLAPAAAAQAAGPGSLDPAFAGGQGVEAVKPGLSATANAIAVAADGSYYVAGSLHRSVRKPPHFSGITLAVFKFHPDGTLDTSSGRGGAVRHGRSNDALALALQPDGKLLAAGGKVLIRYLPDGTRDPSFGHRGVIVAPGPAYLGPGIFTDVGVDARGHIVALAPQHITIFREDGSMFRRERLPDDLIGPRLLVRPDGHFFVFATRNTQSSLAFGYLRNGNPDPAFGTDGAMEWSPGSWDDPSDVLLQPDGAMLVASFGVFSGVEAVTRILPDGALDPSFGSGGRAQSVCGCYIRGLTLEPDGRILAASVGSVPGSQALMAFRLLPDGSLDTSFGDSGTVVTPVQYEGESVAHIAAADAGLTPTGSFLIAGDGYVNTHQRSHLVFAQYLTG